ncbi:maleylpyruvate isomerase family mycothiol-dependent enzyme [Rhodococcus sp. AG1013]|uniref:maleylpyruvate isomerase family mycothiol-dependent enzyme n=1 Tax=unclassified Rhodococcus (in: high G+C Gram-positive bacteria) TaxID=192944 RepID=UPI000E2DC2A3|nr:maleylpyruvate isomerase family mycothiol-dependent enzyme [Rhodococcus sp. AG1013]RDI16685.1 uncharacterized protein (TIGR03083 family) [Rhodococcus sp. AG1013]
MNETTDASIQAMIAAERGEMADLLAALPADLWNRQTLCEGWRVREVIAHTTMPYRYSTPRIVLGIVMAGGNFNRFSDRAARRDAEAVASDRLVSCLRENVHHPWKPPGGGFAGALSHDVIHGLDITVGLGLDRQVPLERLQLVLDGVTPKNLKYFGVDLDGVELRATDLDFTLGSGSPVTGSAQDVLLAVSGRKLPPGHLHGVQAHRFTRS